MEVRARDTHSELVSLKVSAVLVLPEGLPHTAEMWNRNPVNTLSLKLAVMQIVVKFGAYGGSRARHPLVR
jgi:hypothetical protein